MSLSKLLKLSIQLRKKSSRGPKFDGDAKQTLEIRVKRKVALKPKKGKKEKKVLAAAGNRTRDQLNVPSTYHRTSLNVQGIG